MKARLIGGFGFVAIFYATLLLGAPFLVVLAIFLVVGFIELLNLYKLTNHNLKLIPYTILYVLFILSMYYLQGEYLAYLVYITVVIMCNDSFAFLVGIKFGKHKLSSLSPKKTIEGSLGGLILAPFISIPIMFIFIHIFNLIMSPFVSYDILYLLNYNPFDSQIILIIMCIIIAVVSQLGDLLESYFKRNANIKDSGNFIYGHGGILDRVDSWMVAIPVSTLLLIILV